MGTFFDFFLPYTDKQIEIFPKLLWEYFNRWVKIKMFYKGFWEHYLNSSYDTVHWNVTKVVLETFLISSYTDKQIEIFPKLLWEYFNRWAKIKMVPKDFREYFNFDVTIPYIEIFPKVVLGSFLISFYW